MRQDTKACLDRYAKFRIPTGSFLHAVLSNDLMEAMGRADEENIEDIVEICQYIYNNLPIACYGSTKAVREWLQERHKL